MNKYTGSNFDDFLREEGIFEEVSECTLKRFLALQIMDIIKGDMPEAISASPENMNASNRREGC